MDRRLLALLPVAVLALSVAGIAAAKDGALAALDTPIPPDAHPGTEIAVAWRAWMPDGGTEWPFAGSPVFIRIISADGGRLTETIGRENPPGSGHYEATIAVPQGGVGRVEVGLFGESCVEGECSRSDLLFELPADQRVPKMVAAPAVMPAATAAGPAAAAPVTAAAAGTEEPSTNLPTAVAIVAAGVLLLVAATGLNRQTRASDRTARG